MPRAARFRIAALGELLRQLRFAPDETRGRQMDAAERLAADIDPARNYPEDFIIRRITGYQPEHLDAPATFIGEALLPDLVTFVQRLSLTLALRPDHAGRRAIELGEVVRRLDVSSKSVQRYRRQGLVCHYVVFPDGEKRLACFADALERFERGNVEQLKRAAGFTRVNGAMEGQIIDAARAMRMADARLSLNEAALALARRHGRAHETIRAMLRRHDRGAAQPIFTERGPLRERELRIIWRAWRFGVSGAALARRFDRTQPAIHRALSRARANRLRSLELSFVALPTFDRPRAAEVILAAPAVRERLNEAPPLQDALALIDAAHHALALEEELEQPLVAAYNFLKRRANVAVNSLEDWPRGHAVDAIETDLRWAAALKRRLAALALPAMVRTLERNLHRPLAQQPGESIVSLLRLAMNVLSRTIETVDPSRDQHLERVASYALDRELARLDLARAAGRARARHAAGAIAVDHLFDDLCAWRSWLDLRRDLIAHVAALDESFQELVIARYGLNGAPPRTIAALANERRLAPQAMTRRLAKAELRLRDAARMQ